MFPAGQTAGARQVRKQSPTWVSKNIAKQHLTVDGGGVSNRRRETPGFLAERGFLIRLILWLALRYSLVINVNKHLFHFITTHSIRRSKQNAEVLFDIALWNTFIPVKAFFIAFTEFIHDRINDIAWGWYDVCVTAYGDDPAPMRGQLAGDMTL